MIREEIGRLFRWEERHRRLVARILIAAGLTVIVDAVGSVLIWHWESGIKGSDIHGFGDAVWFVSVQVLTVSSSAKNPLTADGKILDVFLEMWAIFVITAVAGSFSSFFANGDHA
jgi:voltage-gated potassium channel